ncbi:trans isomerase A [Seminavis robusta]|uniref:Peptidyl-prolyl cis-trans isomerase n=1 Tax=Seminavis robusta TaxID=568900 RepID=A0A9N8HZN5_9STRA|nr:trans isomerase A [Seminavis robusta]|eukprot:Sro3021_g342240.1 trans isomerase A (287) ;mRNA; f:7838-8977
MGKAKRTTGTTKVGEHLWGVLRSIFLLGLAGGSVFLLAKTSPDSNGKSIGASLRQRQVKEGNDDKGRTFKLNLANLKDGSAGEVVIQTHPEWAPLGAAHFHSLMDQGFYKDTKFFRVVPNFMVQWGISGDPKKTRGTNKPIRDDPVEVSNKRGSISFATAGPNTRTTQLFVNTRKNGNAFLDNQGFSPFAEVISGMEYVGKSLSSTWKKSPTSPSHANNLQYLNVSISAALDTADAIQDVYGEDPSQGNIEVEGNKYLDKHYPKLSYIADIAALEQADGTEKDGNN